MHVNTYRSRQSCIISRPSTLEMFWGTGSSKCLKQATALRWIFAPQFVISLKNTRTGKDCTSNALENTSIKNWLIQWNRAEPGETGRRDSHRRTLATLCAERRRRGLEKKGFLIPITFKDSATPSPSCRMGLASKTIRSAPYDLEPKICSRLVFTLFQRRTTILHESAFFFSFS